jgi:long-chain acyl-CoA synthetase
MITLINKFTLTGDSAEFERVWKVSSDFMRSQPGFVSFHLHRSLNRPDVYVNVAVWETAQDHQRVLAGPEFGLHIKQLGALAKPDPDLYVTVIDSGPAA